MVYTSERLANGMLPDGSNPEGVEPVPALDWCNPSKLTNVKVNGPMFSTATTKLRAFLVYGKIGFKHEEWMDRKGEDEFGNGTQGIKPGPYNKVPNLDFGEPSRQVNDSYIILKHLVPLLGLEYNDEWEKKVCLELDTGVKIHNTADDWLKMASKIFGMPLCILSCMGMGTKLQVMEEEQGRRNIEKGGLGHVDKHPVDFAKDFKKAFKGKYFHGDQAGHIDLSVYGFLANLLYCETNMGDEIIKHGNLEAWFASMQAIVPLKILMEDAKGEYKPVGQPPAPVISHHDVEPEQQTPSH